MIRLLRIAPELPVQSLESSLDYYRQRLGFEVALEMPGGDYAIVERDGVAIHLFARSGEKAASVGIHIFVEDLEGLHEELIGRGADITQHIERKPWGNRDFRVRDDAGNEIKFTEPLGD
jgi:uncharacterized glyoxalase superfamily protein PhnB